MDLKKILNEIQWGGSGIERETFEFIFRHIPEKSTIIELGSGLCSTKILSTVYDLFTVEENIHFVNTYKTAKYIHAPLVNNWYNTDILRIHLPQNYSFVFVDGPAGENKRLGLLNHLDLFKKDVPFLIHDTYRPCDSKLAYELADRFNKKIYLHKGLDHFAFLQ